MTFFKTNPIFIHTQGLFLFEVIFAFNYKRLLEFYDTKIANNFFLLYDAKIKSVYTFKYCIIIYNT